jgi:cobalt-zinc-cadmium efflux system membrane fusion protein
MTSFFMRARDWNPARLLAATAFFLSCAAFGGEGHDHGEAAPAAQGTASPRVEAHSELFELVGIVDRGQMTVYLDRYATNEPITGAKIEFEAGTQKGQAQPQADGTYLIKFDALSKPGSLPFAFTVTAGSDSDLLAGDLQMQEVHDEHEESARPWLRWAGYAAGLVAALIAATYLLRRRQPARAAV